MHKLFFPQQSKAPKWERSHWCCLKSWLVDLVKSAVARAPRSRFGSRQRILSLGPLQSRTCLMLSFWSSGTGGVLLCHRTCPWGLWLGMEVWGCLFLCDSERDVSQFQNVAKRETEFTVRWRREVVAGQRQMKWLWGYNKVFLKLSKDKAIDLP